MTAKVGLLGATGRVGGKVMMQALERGFDVFALARNPDKIEGQVNLTVLKGDSTNAEDVKSLIDKTDVIIVCVGVGALEKTAAAVTSGSPKRVIALSNIGVRAGSFVLNFLMKTVVIGRVKVAELEVFDKAFLMAPCPCTVARPAGFAEKPGAGKYNATAQNGMTVRTIAMDDVVSDGPLPVPLLCPPPATCLLPTSRVRAGRPIEERCTQ